MMMIVFNVVIAMLLLQHTSLPKTVVTGTSLPAIAAVIEENSGQIDDGTRSPSLLELKLDLVTLAGFFST